MSHETLFRKADKSLYEAKASGRNRVGTGENTIMKSEGGDLTE